MNSHSRAVVALVISILFLSTSGLLIKLSDWDALALNGARSLIAAGVLWIYLRHPNFTWSRVQVSGAIAYAVMIITFVVATRWTTAANAVFLQFTAPLWVALFGIWLLGERPRRSDWTAMIAIALGMLLFFGDELSATGTWGNLLAIFSGMCMALMLIALRKQKDGSPTETVLLGNLIAGVIGLPFIIFGDQPVNVREISIIFFMGIFQLGLPFIVVTLAVKQLRAIEMILIQTLEPILNPIWVFFFVGEKPSPSALVGATIVTTAVTLHAIATSRRPNKRKAARGEKNRKLKGYCFYPTGNNINLPVGGRVRLPYKVTVSSNRIPARFPYNICMMRTRTWAGLLFLAVLAFYTITLQPSLAWGDGIRLQREVVTAESFILAEMVEPALNGAERVQFADDPLPFARLGVAAWDHPLYVMLGHTLLYALPAVYNLWLVNFLSAIFGAGAISLLFLLCARHTKSNSASLLAALALAVSHTFWWHAVTPEVYTLFAFLLLLAIYWFDSYEENGRFIYLFASAFALGLGIANHLLAVLAVPALILYLLLARKRLRDFPLKLRQLFLLVVAFLLGLSPYLLQFLRLLRTFTLPEVLGTAAGTTFLQGSTALSLPLLGQSVVSYLIFLFYQFLLLGVLLGIYGWLAGRRPYPALWNKAAAFYLVYLAFGLLYRVSDQFAFFLSAHIFWAVAMGMGIAQLEVKVWPDRRWLLTAVLTLPLLLMPLFYDAAPDLLRRAGITEEIFGVPQVGSGVRDGLAYYVNPNKYGDVTADAFGRQVLQYLPPDSLIVAEWYTDTDEYFVLGYFKVVEGLRPDVDLVTWTTEDPFTFDSAQAVQLVAEQLPQRPVYLASLSEEFYDAPTLMREYCIVEKDHLYRVFPRDDGVERPCLHP